MTVPTPLPLYDVHAHLADRRLAGCLPAVLEQAVAAGVCGILACAARLEEWSELAAIARHPTVLGALGLHPFFVAGAPADLGRRLHAALAVHPRLVAVGEIGLDFWEGRHDAARQTEVLSEQLLVAAALDLPVILHNRRSWNDFFALVKGLRRAPLRGVCHCFNGSPEVARAVLDLGLMVSFAGPLTYTQAHRLHAAAAYVPLDRILTETDCPDLPAAAVRPGASRPEHVVHVLAALAAIKRLPVTTIADQVAANYEDLLRPSGGARAL